MDLKDLTIKLKGLVRGTLNREDFRQIGEQIKDTVVNRTQKGFGVDENGAPQTRLKGLSESYKKQRSRLKKQGKLSGNTTANKSNLTKSGKMLSDIKVRATNDSVTVFPSGKDRKKAIYQDEAGRKFMNLSKSEINKIKKEIENKIINDIKKQGL